MTTQSAIHREEAAKRRNGVPNVTHIIVRPIRNKTNVLTWWEVVGNRPDRTWQYAYGFYSLSRKKAIAKAKRWATRIEHVWGTRPEIEVEA